MIGDPFTYVTLSIDPGQPARIDVAFYTPHLQARARVLKSGRPYLTLASEEADVTISTTAAGPVTPKDIEIARQIVDAAARYLADCERLHEQQSAEFDQAPLPGLDGEAAA